MEAHFRNMLKHTKLLGSVVIGNVETYSGSLPHMLPDGRCFCEQSTHAIFRVQKMAAFKRDPATQTVETGFDNCRPVGWNIIGIQWYSQ